MVPYVEPMKNYGVVIKRYAIMYGYYSRLFRRDLLADKDWALEDLSKFNSVSGHDQARYWCFVPAGS